MGIIVDLIIIAVILLSTFLAYKKGLLKLAIGLCAFVISIVVTFILYQPISNLVINITSIDETVENAIYEKANNIMEENNKEDELTNQLIETTKNEMLPETARSLAINIVKGGVILVLFIATKLIIRFVSVIADAIAKLPIISQFNKLGGLAYGLLRGILIIYVALLILKVPEQIEPKNTVNQSIEQSALGKTMYQNNILNVFFK